MLSGYFKYLKMLNLFLYKQFFLYLEPYSAQMHLRMFTNIKFIFFNIFCALVATIIKDVQYLHKFKLIHRP